MKSIQGLFFIGQLRKNTLKVFLLTMLFTAAGMGLRYILKFGEVSNTVNFTIGSVVTLVFILPTFVTLVYWMYLMFNPRK